MIKCIKRWLFYKQFRKFVKSTGNKKRDKELIYELYERSRKQKYSIIINSDGEEVGITCHTCERTSHNINDITNKYCGNCRKFLDFDYELAEFIQNEYKRG